jgi:hypothetical protein
MKKCLSGITSLLLLSIQAVSFGQVPQSGIYLGGGDVFIVCDEHAKTITGSYNTCIGRGQICCTFNFTCYYNSQNDKELFFKTTFPDDTADEIKGNIFCETGRSFSIKLEEEPPGSMACGGINEGTGYKVNLLRHKDWKGIRMIRSRKAFFYSEPKESAKRKAYVTLYDVVGILDTEDGWMKVEYDNADNEKPQTTTGWIRTADIFAKL